GLEQAEKRDSSHRAPSDGECRQFGGADPGTALFTWHTCSPSRCISRTRAPTLGTLTSYNVLRAANTCPTHQPVQITPSRSTAPLHRAAPPRRSTAPLHRAAPPRRSTAPLHRAAPPRRSTAPLHRAAPYPASLSSRSLRRICSLLSVSVWHRLRPD